MPGAYAHMTAVGKAMEGLEKLTGLPAKGRAILRTNSEFCMVGALGPDYPYLDKYHGSDKQWADDMHYLRTGERIKAGMNALKLLDASDHDIAFAWLLGFTAHVVADVTVHPVVELKVGPYTGNEADHRECEINQDVYIFSTQSGLEFQQAEFLKGLSNATSDPEQPDHIHPAVYRLWTNMFEKADGDLFSKNEPNIHSWHNWFRVLAAGAVDEPFVALARHVAPWLNSFTYPTLGDVNRAEYIDALKVPGGGTLSYDEIFARAVANIRLAWVAVTSSVLDGTDQAQEFLRDWDLDTGRELNTNILTFWSES